MTNSQRDESRLSVTLAVMLLARITLNMSYRITYPFLPVIARGLGVDLPTAGLLVTGRATGGLVSPFLGPLSDRYGRKRMILVALSLLIAGAAICALVPLYVAFMVAFVMFGVSKAAFDPTIQAYISDRVPYERRGWAIGVTELSWSGAWLVGVPSSGWLIARAGWQAPYVLLTVLSTAGLLLIAWLLPRDAPVARHSHNPLQLGAVIRNRNLAAALVVTFLMMLANEFTFVVYGAWMENRLGLSVATIGVASIAIGIAEAAGEFSSAAFVDRIGKRRAVLVGMLLLAVFYGLLPSLGQRLEWVIAGLVLLFVAFEFTLVASLPLVSELAPEARATAMSANVAAMTVARMIGSACGTALFAWMGKLEPNAGISVVASVLGFGVLWLFVRENSHTGER